MLECVEDIEDDLIAQWQEGKQHEMRQLLRSYIQASMRAESDLIDEEQTIPYRIGVASGFIRALEVIYSKEGEQANLVETLAQCSGKSRQILDALYQAPGHGMQHGVLASEIGSTTSSLTNIMKKVVASGAVKAFRTGKNTFYHLSDAGMRFCENQRKSPYHALLSGVHRNEFVEAITEAVQRAEQEKAALPGEQSVKLTLPSANVI